METFVPDPRDRASRPEAVLLRARAAAGPALRHAVRSLPGAAGRVAEYHFGWRHADGSPAAGSGGKAIRPALVLAASRALGGAPEKAVDAAAAVELVHNFTLLHDDVLDRDRTRRDRPTAWTVFGAEHAVVAGDAVQALAFLVLARDPHPAAQAASERLARCVVELCQGQHEDLAFERRERVTVEECLAMAEAKTGALLGCACAIGALYAGADDAVADAMDAMGRRLGLAFQLHDDLLGIWGDPAVTGKPVGADLAARKKSLPVVAALASGTREGAALAELYALEGELGGSELRHAAEYVEAAGGRAWAQAQEREHTAAALRLLSAVASGPDAEDLLVLADLVTRRNG